MIHQVKGNALKLLSFRKVTSVLLFSSVVSVVPLVSVGNAGALVTGCATIGNFTTCGTPQSTTYALVNYMKYLTAGIITKDSIPQQQHSAPGYQTVLNQLKTNLFQPTASEQTYMNVFTTMAGVFRNAQIDLPNTYAVENTIWYDPLLTNPNTIWGQLPADLALTCSDYILFLAGA